MYQVYIIYCDATNKSYVGYTVDIQKRLRQHNGEIKGGARATRHGNWRLVALLDDIATRSEAMSIEWHVKRARSLVARQNVLQNYTCTESCRQVV